LTNKEGYFEGYLPAGKYLFEVVLEDGRKAASADCGPDFEYTCSGTATIDSAEPARWHLYLHEQKDGFVYLKRH
jgi:hypothetical protein